MPDRLALYLRPTMHCTAEEQRASLLSWATAVGHVVVREFAEPERKRGTDHRREAMRMLAEARRGGFDRVACGSLLALCRSVRHCADLLAGLDAAGVAVSVLSEGIDTSADGGETMRAFALAAKIEHEVHQERAAVGIRRRIEAGHRHGAPRIPASKEARIVAMLQAGASSTRIRRVVGVSWGVVKRVQDELASAPPLPSRVALTEAAR